jgi:hypothetical protein
MKRREFITLIGGAAAGVAGGGACAAFRQDSGVARFKLRVQLRTAFEKMLRTGAGLRQ